MELDLQGTITAVDAIVCIRKYEMNCMRLRPSVRSHVPFTYTSTTARVVSVSKSRRLASTG